MCLFDIDWARRPTGRESSLGKYALSIFDPARHRLPSWNAALFKRAQDSNEVDRSAGLPEKS